MRSRSRYRLPLALVVALALLAIAYAAFTEGTAELFVSPRSQEAAEPPAPADSKYAIAEGCYRQANVSEQRRLVVQGENRGQLVLDFSGVSALVVGAPQVVIDTTWEVEGDDVTFTLRGGSPEVSYGRVLKLALEEVCRFHIREFGEDALTLVRTTDGEVFQWERTDDEAFGRKPMNPACVTPR